MPLLLIREVVEWMWMMMWTAGMGELGSWSWIVDLDGVRKVLECICGSPLEGVLLRVL